MDDESTVLLVKTDELPDGLPAQLEKKNVFTEEVSLDHLAPALVAVAPDLLVLTDLEHADAALDGAEKNRVPVVVIAARAVHRELKSKYQERISALIPKELPLAALTHRLATFSRRAARGEPLQRTQSVPPKQATGSVASRKGTSTDKKPRTSRASPPSQSSKRQSAEPIDGRSSRAEKPQTAPQTASRKRRQDVQRAAQPSPKRRDLSARAGGIDQAAAKAGGPSAPGNLRGHQSPGAANQSAGSAQAGRSSGRASPSRQSTGSVSRPNVPSRTGVRRTDQGRSGGAREPLRTSAAPAPPVLQDSEPDSEKPESIETAAYELPPEVKSMARRQESVPPGTPPKNQKSVPTASGERRRPSALPPLPSAPQFPAGNASSPEPSLQPSSEQGATEARERLSSAPDKSPNEPFARPSFRERARPSSGDVLSAPTPEQTQRMREADALAQKIRRNTASVSAVRVVICDDDVTRVDAITTELREHGLDVMVLSPHYQKVRWGKLRRYAPHGLLVDERSLSKGSRQIVGAFRRDPFLKYVPLVAIRFDRLYKDEEARVNLTPLFPLLQPLGREELTFLDRLSLSSQLTVDLSQVLPNRLIELLGAYEQTCVLDCTSQGQRLTWPIAVGRAGKAELIEHPGSAGVTLKGEDALRWLLSQDEPQVTVSARPHIQITSAEEIEPLLERLTNSIEPPSEHSIAPPRGSQRPPAGSFAQTLLGVAPAPGATDTESVGTPTIPAPPSQTDAGPSPQLSPSRESQAKDAEGSFKSKVSGWGSGIAQATIQNTVAVSQRLISFVRPQTQRAVRFVIDKKATWPAWQFWGATGIGGAVVLLLTGVLLHNCLASSEGSAAVPGEPTEVQGQRAPSEQGQESKQVPSDSRVVNEAQEAQLGRWRVAADAQLPDCRDLLGKDVPQEAASRALGYWEAARSKLVQGDVKQAHRLMCRSALIDPSGPAAEGLVSFYLGRRSIDNAEKWVKRVLAGDPDRRSALELLADIQNQKGKPKKSLSTLLGTLKLSEDNTHKRELVARKFRLDANRALRSGDLPRAERLLRRAVLLDPDSPKALQGLAEVLLKGGLAEAAELWARKLLERHPDHPGAHMVLGDIARLAEDYSAARKHYKKVAPGSPGAARAEGHLQDMPP